MRFHRSALAVVVATAMLSPALAHGAGYAIYEQGAAALGMAGAATASVHDASAVFYNPAALVNLKGRQAYFGGAWLSTTNSFAGVDPNPGFGTTEEMKNGNFLLPTIYWTNDLGEKWAYGVGVNTPFGLGVDWKNPDTFTGRDRVTKATLKTVNGSFNMAWAASPEFSVAAGFDALFASVELNAIQEEIIPGGGGALANIARVKLESGLKPGYGFNAAVLWAPHEFVKVGAYYRSEVDVDIDDGDATFTQIATGNASFDAAVAAGLPPKQTVTTTLTFPAMWSLGVAWTPAPEWTWEADINWTQWSAFESLDLKFPSDGSLDKVIQENYDDQVRANIGAEHRLPGFTYRFGYYYDQAAAPTESVTPLLPDANRHGATLGLGWTFGDMKQWTLDAYNLGVFVENRSTDGVERDGYNGTYKAYVNAAGLSLAYHW